MVFVVAPLIKMQLRSGPGVAHQVEPFHCSLFISSPDVDSRRGSTSVIQPAGGPVEVPADRSSVRSATSTFCHSHVPPTYHQEHQPLPTPVGSR